MVRIRLASWLAQFCSWHEKARKDELPADLMASYLQARADLGALLVSAQRLEIRPGETARQAVRVARAFPVEFDLRTGKVGSLTLDLSLTGLCALVGEAPPIGTLATFRLKLARTLEITGRCRVVATTARPGSTRMAVSFDELSPGARGHIESLVFDALCSEIRTSARD